MAENLVKEIFEVAETSGINEDGTSRAEILKRLREEGEDTVTFHRGPLRDSGNQIIYVTVNGETVGELFDIDYIRYSTNLPSAKQAYLAIHESDSGELTADVILKVPYMVSSEGREQLRKRKVKIIWVMIVLFAFTAIYSLLHGDLFTAAVGGVAVLIMLYWIYIRDPKKDDKVYRYLKTGRK